MKKALTLVEVLISSFILVITIVSFMTIFSHYYRMSLNSEKNFLCENYIKTVFEELMIQPSRLNALEILERYPTTITGGGIKTSLGTVTSLAEPTIEEVTVNGANAQIFTFTLHFTIQELTINNSELSHLSNKPSLLFITATAQFSGGSNLVIKTFLTN